MALNDFQEQLLQKLTLLLQDFKDHKKVKNSGQVFYANNDVALTVNDLQVIVASLQEIDKGMKVGVILNWTPVFQIENSVISQASDLVTDELLAGKVTLEQTTEWLRAQARYLNSTASHLEQQYSEETKRPI